MSEVLYTFLIMKMFDIRFMEFNSTDNMDEKEL